MRIKTVAKLTALLICLVMVFSAIQVTCLAAGEPVEIALKLTTPVVGKTIDRAYRSVTEVPDGVGMITTGNYETTWLVKSGSEWQKASEYGTFENGKEYAIRIKFSFSGANAGKYATLNKAYINGIPVDIQRQYDSADAREATFIVYSFGVLNKDKVYSISVEGGYAQYDNVTVTEAKAGQKIKLVPTPPDSRHGIWYWDGLGISSMAVANSSFEFSMPSHDVDVKAVWGKIISEASCTTKPMNAGDTEDNEPQSADPEKYRVYVDHFSGTKDENGKLIDGKQYYYCVGFSPLAGYVFSDSCKFTVNGNSTFLSGRSVTTSGHLYTLYRNCEFVAHDANATEIQKIVINNITVPVAGAAPNTAGLTTGTPGYQIQSAEWLGHAYGVGNYVGYLSSGMISTFESNWKYVLRLTLAPEKGYYFPSDPTTVTGNGGGIYEYHFFNKSANTMSVYLRYNLGKTYKVTAGSGATWMKGSDKSLTFVANGSIDTLRAVCFDGTDSSFKFEKDGSANQVRVTYAPQELQKLDDGPHTIWFYFSDGEASGTFTILANNLSDDGLLGDVNGDGKVNAADALLTLKAAVGKVSLDETQTYAADVNGDGKVNASDALAILKKAVGKPAGF